MFWYNPTSTQPSNSWLNFLPSNPSVPGCWFRQYDNGPVNVLWAGIKGDGVFDNTSRLQLLHNNCFWGVGVEPRSRLELYFPIGTYLTGKIDFYGINLSGDNLLTTSIVSKPGEDIFYFPDPTLYETGSLSANIDFFIVKNLTFRMDCSQHGTFPNRTYWPVTGNWSAGLTVADGFYYIASGNVYLCTDGGVTGSVPPTHTTGVAIDGSVKWYYVDNGQKTYGAAAFACPLSNGQLANSIPVQPILHPRFENVTVVALDHGPHPSTNECGFYIQRPIYGGTWDKCTVRFLHGGWITAATNLYPNAYDWAPDTNNWFGCDTFCDIPFRMFGGSHGTVVGLSVYATGVGQRCIELFPFSHINSGLRPGFWSFVGLYQEPNVASTGPICIIGGYKNVIDSMELSFGSAFTDFLGNNNKISSAWMPNYGATAPTIRIFGNFNSIEDLKIGTVFTGNLSDVVNDQGSGNRVLFANVDSYAWRSERTVSTIGNRPPMGFLTNEFLMKGNYSNSFYDMLVGGREFYASAWGDPMTPVADKTLETGGYGRRTECNGSIIWPDSAGRDGNYIGSRFPAAKCRFIVKGRVGIPCNSYIVPSVATPSLAITNVASMNPSWTTAWSIFSMDVDLSAYGLGAAGGPYRFCPLFSAPDITNGQVQDIAWWALVPYAQENSVIVNRYPGGIVDTYGEGTPEGALVAPTGSTYRRSDGSAGTSFYVKTGMTSSTGWIAIA